MGYRSGVPGTWPERRTPRNGLRETSERQALSDSTVIIGGGLAGLFCALKLAPTPVTLLTGTPLGVGAPQGWEQDDIARALLVSSDPESLAREAALAGDGLVDRAVMLGVAREAGEWVRDLVALTEGQPGITQALVDVVRRTPSIQLVVGFAVESLIEGEAGFLGVRARGEGGYAPRSTLIPARAIVLATRGAGQFYAPVADLGAMEHGIALAACAGAVIGDAEFVQFQSSMVEAGDRPVDAVASQTTHLGGVRTDEQGRTNVPFLWAIGECAATGLHGAGPASNALIEALVFAARVAEDLKDLPHGDAPDAEERPDPGPERPLTRRDADERLPALRAMMMGDVGPNRDRAGLSRALTALMRLRTDADGLLMEHAATAALMIAAAALLRRESRGVHRRADHPEQDPKAARRRSMRLDEALRIAERVAAEGPQPPGAPSRSQ